jgi:hypothetical protein
MLFRMSYCFKLDLFCAGVHYTPHSCNRSDVSYLMLIKCFRLGMCMTCFEPIWELSVDIFGNESRADTDGLREAFYSLRLLDFAFPCLVWSTIWSGLSFLWFALDNLELPSLLIGTTSPISDSILIAMLERFSLNSVLGEFKYSSLSVIDLSVNFRWVVFEDAALTLP